MNIYKYVLKILIWYSVKVTLLNGPDTVYIEEKPKHKKNSQIGTKKTAFYKFILLDQDDALTFKDNEEVVFLMVFLLFKQLDYAYGLGKCNYKRNI